MVGGQDVSGVFFFFLVGTYYLGIQIPPLCSACRVYSEQLNDDGVTVHVFNCGLKLRPKRGESTGYRTAPRLPLLMILERIPGVFG